MKLCILFLAVLGFSAAAALPTGKVLSRATRDLNDDLQDFAALVPVDEILVIIIEYLAEDAEVQALVEYVQSEDFIQLVVDVEAIPEYIELLDFLDAGGLAVYDAVNALHSFLGLPALVATSKTVSRLVSTRITGGVAGLIADIKAVLPLAEIRALYEEKLQTSEDFAALVALIASDDFQNAVAQVKANEQYEALRAKALAAGIDVEAISDLLLTLLGINGSASKKSIRVTRDLSSDLEDFAALVPVDDILVILIEYLAEDEQVQALVEYVQSGDFIELVLAVEAIPEYIELLNVLEAGGLAVYDAVNALHSFLGIPALVATSKTVSRLVSTRITGGVAGLIADIKALLPLDKIRALYEEKLQTSEDFAALVALIASDNFQNAVAEVKANEEYQALRAKALEAGIDVDAISNLLLTLLGLA